MFINNALIKKQSNNRGFTLLEMTLALGIFVILFTLTLSIYSASIRAEQKTIQMSKLQKEAQLIMEILVKQIRSSKIDYEYYGGPITTTDILALRDKNNKETVFYFDSVSDSITVCTEDCGAAAGVFTPIPPGDVLVSGLTFSITPITNPFIGPGSTPGQFPRTTIILKLLNTKGTNTRTLIVQQTVPQRLPGP